MEEDTSSSKIDPKWMIGQNVNKSRAVVAKKKSVKDRDQPSQTKLPSKLATLTLGSSLQIA